MQRQPANLHQTLSEAGEYRSETAAALDLSPVKPEASRKPLQLFLTCPFVPQEGPKGKWHASRNPQLFWRQGKFNIESRTCGRIRIVILILAMNQFQTFASGITTLPLTEPVIYACRIRNTSEQNYRKISRISCRGPPTVKALQIIGCNQHSISAGHLGAENF